MPPVPSSTSFRINARSFFLTYAQCSLDKSELLTYLLNLEPSTKFCRVSCELHEDGHPHLHVLLTLSKKRDIRDKRHFDWMDQHPNIQSARNIVDVLEYISKDGNFVDFGVPPGTKNVWTTIVAANSKEDFLSLVKEHDPCNFVLRHEQIINYANIYFEDPLPIYRPKFTEYTIPTVLQHWVDTELHGTHDRRKSLVLCSPSRFGKTQWARSLGVHCYFNTMVDFKPGWDNGIAYVIFDDFLWEYVPNKKCFFGGQEAFTLTDKYRKKQTVQWGRVLIYLCNELPPLDDWYKANTVIISLHKPLF